MAHEIDMTNDRANVAYVGETPWHGLGFQLDATATIDDWRAAAGMDWTLKESPVVYLDAEAKLRAFADRKILYRSDTNGGLSVVGSGYKVVQPGEILEFYRDLTSAAGFSMETAGVLFGGRKFWALAAIGQEARILGQDAMKGYLLLATSCDGSLATVAQFTSVRVVCNNTLSFSLGANAQKANVRVPHSREFDASAVKADLGIAAESWSEFIKQATHLAKTKVSRDSAIQILADAMKIETVDPETGEPIDLEESKIALRDIMRLYDGAGLGSDFKSSRGTLWGVVNATTEWADHRRGTRSTDSRLDRAWFGDGAALKRAVWDAAVKIAA